MALFSRIFQGKKNRNPSTKWYTSETNKPWSEPTFSQSQVRMVIFRDQDFKGRGLLFDSKAVHRVPDTDQNDKKGSCRFGCSSRKPPPGPPDDVTSSPNTGPRYTFSRPGSDTKMLEEMVFGAVGMAFRGSSLKVHTIRSPAQLMLTKVFAPSLNRTRESGVESESLDLSLNCSSTELTSPQKITDKSPRSSSNMAQSVPMDVPSPPPRGYDEHETEDSGFSTSAASSYSSLAASLPRSSSSSSLTSNSLTSMTRRWRRNQQTSLEHNILKRQSDEGVFDQPIPLAKRPPKIGIGIIIYLPEDSEEASKFQEFFFSHVTLIEGLVNKLKVGVERALSNRKLFVHMTVEELGSFRQLIEDLYLTPRIEEPVWLHMMCYTTRRVSLCQRFLREFMTAVSKYDTKSSKFFLSTLITGVLTHHLAWVPTVTPAGATPSRTYLDKHSAKWLDAVAKSHPYNPLWAQLGDLYGAIGFPVRLSRTIVVGRKPDLVNKILYILSYFIRCSQVHERVERSHDFDDFKVEEDAPELTMEGTVWSDRDTISQTSSSCSDLRSVSTSAVPRPTVELLVDGCSQCQANRETPSDHGADVTSVSVTSQSRISGGGDAGRVRLKRQEGHKRGEEEGESDLLNDPGGGGGTVVMDNFDVTTTQKRTAEYVKSVQTQLDLVKNVNHDDKLDSLDDLDLSLTYPGAVIPMETMGDSMTPLQEKNYPVCDSQIAVLYSDLDAQVECRMSPTRVNEEPTKARTRHVGREVTLDLMSGLEELKVGSSKLDQSGPGGGHNEGTTATEVVDQRTEYCHDSGMYDTDVTTSEEPNEKVTTYVRDSGLAERSPCSTTSSPHSDKSVTDPEKTSPSSKQITPERNPEVGSNFPKAFSFSRSNSMFDEYFSESSEPVPLVRSPPARSKSDAERFKRMASIEGSSSIFDEYMHIPCPDISTRISEVSDTSLRSAGAVDADVSIFDEYFTDAERLNCKHQTGTKASSAGPGAGVENRVDDKQKTLVHLAERRNAKRPDSLLVKPADGDKSRLRQSSGQSTATVIASRTHSATPTELNRRRHASNLSTTSSIEADVFQNLKEVNMPRCELLSADVITQTPKQSFSRSLLAGFSPHYLSDFVLHGTSDTNFQAKLHNDLTMSVQNSVLDEPIAEASCVVADMDQWSVKLQTCHYERPDRVKTQEVAPSPLVCNIVESVHDLWRLKMSPEFCLMHLEDRLQEIFFKSRTLAEFIRCHKRIDLRQVATLLKLDYNDIPLLLAVAGTHSPHRNMAFL